METASVIKLLRWGGGVRKMYAVLPSIGRGMLKRNTERKKKKKKRNKKREK